MNIRKEKDSDKEKIWSVNAEAFETESEAILVLELKRNSLKDQNGIIKYHAAFGSV